MSIRSKRSTFEARPPRSEAEVQEALAHRALFRYRHATALDNTSVFGWESDLLTVTGAGIVHEYEIKVDRGDFLSELRAMTHRRRRGDSPIKSARARVLRGEQEPFNGRPNHFWVAATPDVAAPEEVPDFAGFVLVNHYHPTFVEVLRDAPRLHREKLDERTRAWIERGLAIRRWS